MANMERIIRPHLPPNIAPTDTVVRCRVPPENTVVQFGLTRTASATTRSATESYDYAADVTCYMKKQEREFMFGGLEARLAGIGR